MTSKFFTIKQIDKLIELFPYLQIRYEIDVFSESHFVEILPIQSYKNDKFYISEEQRIISQFIQEYPFETITFLSEGDLFSIENPIYSKKGWEYDLKELSFEKSKLILEFPKFLKEGELVLTKFFPQASEKMGYEFSSSIMSEYSLQEGFDSIRYFQEVKTKTEIASNTQYALAA